MTDQRATRPAANATPSPASTSTPFIDEIRQQLAKGRIEHDAAAELERRLERIRQYGQEYEMVGLSPELKRLVSVRAVPDVKGAIS